MRDAAKLRLRIFEVRYCFAGVGTEIANVVVRRISLRLVACQDGLPFFIQRSDHSLVSFGVAAEKTRRFKGLEIQTIDERSIALRRRTLPRQEDEIAVLHD